MKSYHDIIIKRIFIGLFTFLPFLTISAQHHEDSPNEISRVNPPPIKPGLQIDRDMLVKKITESDKDLVFKQEKEINKLPNFLAVNANKTTVQLVGKPDELILAKWTFFLNTDARINNIELQKMAWFASLMGEKAGVDWIITKSTGLSKDFNKAFKETKIFSFNRTGEIIYEPKNKIFTLTFTPW